MAKQYALGSPFSLICTTVEAVGYDWNAIRQQLLDTFPDDKTYYERKAELAKVTRNTGETLSAFWVRLYEAKTRLRKERQETGVSLQEGKVTVFLTALPKHFQSYLTEEDMKDPPVVYKKALQFVTNNPQLKLSEAHLLRETCQPVAAVASSEPQAAPYAMKEDTRGPSCKSIKCFRCHKSGHIAKYCCAEAYRNCGLVGHTAETCRRPAVGRGQGRGGVVPRQKYDTKQR